MWSSKGWNSACCHFPLTELHQPSGLSRHFGFDEWMNFWSEIQAAPPMLLMSIPTDVKCRCFSLPQLSAVGTCSKFCCMGSSINRCFREFSSQYQHFVIAVGDESHIKFHFYLTASLQRFKRRKKQLYY